MSSSRQTSQTTAPSVPSTFGDLLKHLRHRAGLTQGQVAALVGVSLSQISLLEKNKRQPDLQQIVDHFLPALTLTDEPQLAQRLLELAAEARGERLSITRTVSVAVTDELIEYSSLPSLPVRVIGRQSAIDAICKRLMDAPGRLLTLVGSPGVGKTTLAIAAAAVLQPFFDDGVTFVPLAPLNDPTQLAATLASTLGLSDSSNKPAQTRLIEFMRRKSMLLVLDNFEHLLPSSSTPHPSTTPSAAKLVADLLSECPGLRVLTTSREPLRLRAEQRQPVHPLELADGVTLFFERAQAVEPTFDGNATQRPIIEAICTRLDGLPLAIELIAARADLLSPQQMLDRLSQQPLHTLTSDLHDLPERHRTLRNAIQHSYALLSADEQRTFRVLGVFVGGFDQAAAAALGAEEASVRSLAKKNLVRSERIVGEKDRFSLLETLRHFALERHVETGEEGSSRAAHCRYFADFAQAVFEGVRGDQQAVWLQWTQIDHDNFRAALRFALDQQDGDSALAIASGLWWFWYRQGFINEGRRWLQESLQCPSPLTRSAELASKPHPLPLTSKLYRANAYNGAGSMASEQSNYASATAYFQEALAIFNELDNPQGIMIVLHNMALVARGQGAFAQALRWLEESLELERHHSFNKANEAISMANIGVTAFEMGDLVLAKRWLNDALHTARGVQNGWTVAFIAGNLAEVLRVANDLTRAAQLAEESLSGFEALNDLYYTPEPKLNLATIALLQGDLSTARTLARAVLQHYDEMKDEHGIANVLHVLARIVLAEMGTIDGARRAAQMLGLSIHLRQQVGRPLSIHEEKERSDLLAEIAGIISVAERDRLIENRSPTEWRDLVL